MSTTTRHGYIATTSEADALRAAFDRARGASNYWVQWFDEVDAEWRTEQCGADRVLAAARFAERARYDHRRVILGADDAEHIIVCTTPAYERWADPR